VHVFTELHERDGEEEGARSKRRRMKRPSHRDARKIPEEKPRPSETSV